MSANRTFSDAIRAVRCGARISREGWNGKDMFVIYQKGYPDGIPCNMQTAIAWGMNEGDNFICNPYLQIQNVNGSHSMWVPSSADVLAEDWVITVDEEPCMLQSCCGDFTHALDALKSGKAIYREGWNGTDMFVYLVPAGRFNAYTEIGKTIADEDGKVNYAPYMALKTKSNVVYTWVPSINDILLATDWKVKEL